MKPTIETTAAANIWLRELHKNQDGWCQTCRSHGYDMSGYDHIGYPTRWPCDIIKALDAEREQALEDLKSVFVVNSVAQEYDGSEWSSVERVFFTEDAAKAYADEQMYKTYKYKGKVKRKLRNENFYYTIDELHVKD